MQELWIEVLGFQLLTISAVLMIICGIYLISEIVRNVADIIRSWHNE